MIVWFLVLGAALVVVSLAATRVERLPISAAMIYLAVGFAMGRWGGEAIDPVHSSKWLELIAELGVILSVFTCGLRLRPPLKWRHWALPVRLATTSMVVTVSGITLVGRWLLGLEWGEAILLGAILAPTDPVLASEVQLKKAGDPDQVRFGITGEAGLNDGSAFPFVMLGLGLLGHRELGAWGWRWLALDVIWAIGAGLAIGFALGWGVGRLVVYLRTRHREALGRDDLLALGLIALSYGLALTVHAYGFLAVFAAGLSLRRMEGQSGGARPDPQVEEQARAGRDEEIATHPEKSAAFMAEAVLSFDQRLERLTEFGLLVVVGLLLAQVELFPGALWVVPLLFFVIRPLSVAVGLGRARLDRTQRWMVSWFGVRGIGSLYYLYFAANHGLSAEQTRTLTSLVLTVIAASVFAHGISVTPLMERYQRRRGADPA